MAEEMERAEFEYTYTYDQFAVFSMTAGFLLARRAIPLDRAAWTV